MTPRSRPAAVVDARTARPSAVPGRARRSPTSTPTPPRVSRVQDRRACAAGRAQRALRRTAGDALRQQHDRGDTRSVLLVLQGMDTAGKGGIVKHVVGAGNPQGIRYTSFGKPTEEELRAPLPVADPQCAAAGRPHRRVRPLALRGRADRPGAQPGAARGVGRALRRDQRVRAGTRRRRHDDRQGRDVRLARRAEEAAGRTPRPARTSTGSTTRPTSTSASCGRSTRRPIRRCWTSTSTDYAPWYVVPCDRKWYSRLAVTELLIEALKGLNLSWPPAGFRRRGREEAARRLLALRDCPTPGK